MSLRFILGFLIGLAAGSALAQGLRSAPDDGQSGL